MLKMLLAVLLILPLAAFDAGDKYLSKIELYQKDSYYKNQVYAEHDWKSFYKLKDANAIIDPAKYDMHLLSAAVFFATNKWREQKGARPLQFSAGLRDAATVHSWQMVEKNFFDHYNNFTPALRSPEQRLKIYHAEKQANGENIDWNHTNIQGGTTYIQLAETVVNDLYHSPPHRKNMMSKTFTCLGCGAVLEKRDRDGVRYVKATQDFSTE